MFSGHAGSISAPVGVEREPKSVDDARAAAATLFDLDPESVRCPYPIFGALREQAGVAWFDQLDAFVVSRYDLIVEVLRQPERFSSKSATGPLTDRQVATLMRELVADDHEI